MRRIDDAIEVLYALNHTAVECDLRSNPEGYKLARKLKLIEGVNPVPSPTGDLVLMSLGMVDNIQRRE